MEPQTVEGVGESSLRAFAAMLPDTVAQAVVDALRGGLSHSSSPQVGELVKAFCRAKKEFSAIEKDRRAKIPGKEGKTGYEYGYATLASALEATEIPLAEQEIMVTNLFSQDRGEIEVTAKMIHSSDQFMSSNLWLPLPASGLGPQVLGSLITYLRRYLYLALLGIAPSEDDDGQDAQRGADHDAVSVETLVTKLRTDVAGGIADVRAAVTAAAGCGDISQPRLGRLMAIASKEKGWSEAEVGQASLALLGVQPAQIPWKAYDLVVALFQTVTAEQARTAARSTTKSGGSKGAAPLAGPPTPAAAPPAAEAAPAEAATAVSAPTWEAIWAEIKSDYDSLPPEAAADPIDKASLDVVIKGFGRTGWTPVQVAAILLAELRIEPGDLPKDGTHPPVFRKIAKAFREFKPADLSKNARERYRAAAVSRGDVPQTEEGGAASVSEIIAAIKETPVTAAEAWGQIRAAMDAIRGLAPDALVPCSPDDRLVLIGYKDRNGNRTSADVAALAQHHLKIPVEQVPAILFEQILSALAGFPSVAPGREELLAKLPDDARDARATELRDLLHLMIQAGVLSDEEVPRTGTGGNTVSKSDMMSAIERGRERLLMEGGYAG